jgi:phage FluMu protein Com
MSDASATTVKCPACGKFLAQVSGVRAQVILNCKTRRCGSEIRITYADGAVTTSVVGKSNEHLVVR